MFKKENNKGFSLIEIVIGIGMLAVIVIPILHTFITSAQINRDSRQVMIQTEVAQTIMEGFAGKTFLDVRASVGALQSNSGVVSADKALSSIDENLFNTAGSYNEYQGTQANSLRNRLPGTAVSCNSVIWNGSTIGTQSLVSDNFVMASMNQAFADDLAAEFEAHAGVVGLEARMFSFYAPNSSALFIGYGNIHYESYRFDAVVSFLPMAKESTDEYYTYRILLTLYEYTPEMHVGTRFKHVLMTMDGGIMAGRL